MPSCWEYALEELADEIVLTCEEECTVEEITVGEEEYPATWISYTQERGDELCYTDYYLIGYEGRIYQIRLDCQEDALEGLGMRQQIALSTLRLDSVAEG